MKELINVTAEQNASATCKPKPLDLDPSVYLRNDYVVVDFETSNKDHGSPINPDNCLVLAAWVGGKEHPSFTSSLGVRTQFGNEFEQRNLLDDIGKASFVVAFHAKFECGWLLRCGVDLRTLIVYDPMLGEFVLAGNRKPIGGLSLDSTLKRYGLGRKMSYVSNLIAQGVCPSDIPLRDLEEYCVRDVRRTHSLFLRQRQELAVQRLLPVLYGRCLQTPMLADIETRGVWLDEERVRTQAVVTLREWNRLDGELQGFTGAVNWNSPKQVCGLLYEKLGFEELKDYRGTIVRTDSGAKSASETTISRLRPRNDEQSKFKALWLKLAPLKKQVSTLETMRGICDEDAGHFFATFNQAIAGNHRLTSTGGKWGLQLQNSPRAFKGLFRARDKGRQLAEGDCPQLEFRVGVDLSGDPVGRGDVLARADIHSLTSHITGFSRQEAKPHTFKPLYGGRSGPPRLRAYYDAFRQRYSCMYDHQMEWVYTVLETKKLQTATGLVFYWPDTEVTRSGFITNTPAIFNYPISMFATADISQLSLCLLWHMLGGMDSVIVNTIHDSGVLDCPDEEVDKVRELMVYCYTEKIYDVLHRLYDYSFRTPLGLGFKSGTHWGVGVEIKHEPEGRFKFTSDKATEISL